MTLNSWSSIQNINVGGSELGKKNALFNLISHQLDVDKFIYILKIHMIQNITC